MPTHHGGRAGDAETRKLFDKIFNSKSAPESNPDAVNRQKLDNSFRAEPSARPSPQINKQPFIENLHSRSRPQGYEDKSTQARQQARQDFLRTTGQIKEATTGARTPGSFTPKASPTTVVNPPTSTPRPAIPGAGVASGVASLGIGYLVDRYATPYLMDVARRSGGILSAELSYKLGNISQAELAEALRFIRDGNGSKWGERVNQLRTIQRAAKLGVGRIIESDQLPFTGGKGDGVGYYITIQKPGGAQEVKTVYGPVQGAIVITNRDSGGGYSNFFGIICRGFYISGGIDSNNNVLSPGELKPYFYAAAGTFDPTPLPADTIVKVERVDGQPEEITQQPVNARRQAPIIPPAKNTSPLNSQTPPTTDKPPEINKAKPNIIIIPAGFPIGVSGNDKTVQVIPSTTSPSTVEVSHPRTQEPTKPDEEKKVPPLTIANPNSPDIKLETSGSGPVTINIPGYNPITVNPGTNKPEGALPIQDVQRQYQPVAKTATPTKPGTTPATPTSPTTNPATKDDLEQFKKDIEKLITTGTVLAGLTPAIQSIGEKVTKIGENTTPESITTAAAAGTCRTTQPGGCTTKALDDAVVRINQNSNNNANALDAANALANTAQIGMLEDITRRIGSQLPGGLAGKLSRFVNWAAVDRITNIVTMFGVLHNVMMLSNSVKETFLDVLDNLLQTGFNVAPNLFKKADENEAIDAREYIGGALNTFFGGLFGVSEWTALKAQWKAYSTIYSSSAQAYNNLREIHNDSQELLNMARNYTAELGNALVDEGVISEENWQHKDDKKKIKSKVFGKLQRMGQGLEELDNKLEAIEQVTSLLLNITNTAKEIKENIEAIDKGVKDANEAAKKDRDAKIEGLELPNFSLDDIF